MGHLTLEYMSRVYLLKGKVKDYFLQDGMGKLLSDRVKCRQLISYLITASAPITESQLLALDLCLIHQFSVIGNALGAGFIFLLPLWMVFFYQFNKIFIGLHMYQCMVFMHHPTAHLTFILFPFHGLIGTRLEMSSIYLGGSSMSRKKDDGSRLLILLSGPLSKPIKILCHGRSHPSHRLRLHVVSQGVVRYRGGNFNVLESPVGWPG